MNSSHAISNPKDDILLNKHVIKVTDNFLSSGNIPHAILFSGNEWVGKVHNALFFTKKLFCYNGKTEINESTNLFGEVEPTNFSFTDEVEEMVNNLSHPDLLYISRSENNKNISVDQIRELSRFLSLTPSSSLYRVAIINPVEDLNQNSANALLKALEEPNHNTVLILISHNKHKILDTIKSRCLCIDFKNLNEDTYFNSSVSKQLDQSKLKEVQKISNNSPFIAKDILSSDVTGIYSNFISLIEEENININKLSSIAKKLKDDESGKLLSNFFKLLLSEESSNIKNNKISESSIQNWFKLLRLYNDMNRSNLDVLDILKEIINIIKYK